MSLFKYSFFFKINYATTFGYNLCIVGNIKQLGSWNPMAALRLDWTEFHNWTSKLVIHHNRKEIIEYKYIVCRVEGDAIISVARWEDGPNRIIDLTKTSNLNCILDDVWGHRKVVLRLKNELSDASKSIHIIGDDEALGGLKSPKKMEFVLKRDPITKLLERYWEYVCWIDSTKQHLKYYYVLYDEKEKKLFWERYKERKMDLDVSIEIKQGLKTLSNSLNSIQFSDCLYFKCKLNKYKKIDCNFHLNFYSYKVNENLILGTFPYNSEEVDFLRREGVKAILNINTLEEINFTMINWDIITKYYPDKDFELIDFQMIDYEPNEVNHKMRYAAYILHNLITNYKKVYVHSTLGKWKVTDVILNYLCIYKNFSPDAALKFIRLKTPSVKNRGLNKLKNNNHHHQYGQYKLKL